MIISDHNIIETVIKDEDRNEDIMADRRNECESKQLKMYKWYEGKQRRDGKTLEMFFLGTEYLLCRQEIESAARVLNDMLGGIGWPMERRGNGRKD
jgi:hypothetical protein